MSLHIKGYLSYINNVQGPGRNVLQTAQRAPGYLVHFVGRVVSSYDSRKPPNSLEASQELHETAALFISVLHLTDCACRKITHVIVVCFHSTTSTYASVLF